MRDSLCVEGICQSYVDRTKKQIKQNEKRKKEKSDLSLGHESDLTIAKRSAVALEAFGRPTLVGDAVINDVTSHDESVLEQSGILAHGGSRQQSGTTSEHTAVTDDQRVEVEDTTRVDVRNQGCIINGNAVTKGKKIGLGEHQRR
jgi:hypothetical protein